MSEREIRFLLRTICADLDAKARKAARKVVLPTMLGAGLALAGGCDDGRPVPTDAKVVSEAGPLYMASDGGLVYMAPDAGPIPPYTAPDAAIEDGIVPKPDMVYVAPDAGPIPPYTAPDAGQD